MKLLASVFIFLCFCSVLVHQTSGVLQQGGGNCHVRGVTTARISGVPKGYPMPSTAKINQKCERSLEKGLELWFGPQV